MRSRIWMLTALAWLASGGTLHAEDCRKPRTKLDHVTVTDVQKVAAGSVVGGSPKEPIPAAQADYCRIQGMSKPTVDSDIRFELWIPGADRWNGKFEQVGNGGFAGAIPYGLMSRVLALGYAVAGTDDGHQSADMTDASWALDHPEKVQDYGWRAIAETTLASKAILRELTTKMPAKSYFVGCSDGGREALMMAQRFPQYFDGIIAGAPAYSMTRLLTGGAARTRELGGTIARLAPAHLALLQRHVLHSCGSGAPYLKDPRQCHVDLAPLECAAGAAKDCLSEAEVHAARTLYAELKDPMTGAPLYGVLPGAEAAKGSWDVWLTGTDDGGPAAGSGFTWNYLAFMVMNDPKLDIRRVSDSDLIRGERLYAPIMDADNPDLSSFKARGGKLIQYHGWNDPAIPAGYSLEYAGRVAASTAGVGDFYRLYMVPGMLHCRGGDAPTLVDWQSALEAWIERAVPPGELIARDDKGTTQTLEPFH